jgi:sigma-B regulation protein RsbU (phosphoserine phosphatase)
MIMTNKSFATKNKPGKAAGSTRKGLPRRKSPAKQAADTVENTLALQQELDSVRREYGKLQQAIYEAAQVQRRMCAPREMAWGDFEIAGESFPVRHLCGDFFKVMELGSALGLILGDIAGKGLTAGIWQAHLMGVMQRCARAYERPCDAIAGVNRELCQDFGERPITALFFARLDAERGELVYCNAGLPAPLVLRQDQSVQQLEEGGPMLGALNEATYGSGTVRMDAGDMLLAYSDGLTECMNAKQEEFETRRLVAATKSVSGANASRVLFSTLAAVLDFADACTPGDDLTLLVVRRRTAAIASDSTSEKDFAVPRRRANAVARAQAAAN